MVSWHPPETHERTAACTASVVVIRAPLPERTVPGALPYDSVRIEPITAVWMSSLICF